MDDDNPINIPPLTQEQQVVADQLAEQIAKHSVGKVFASNKMIWRKSPPVFDNYYVARGDFPNLQAEYEYAFAQESFYRPIMDYFKGKGFLFTKTVICLPDEKGRCDAHGDTFIIISW